MTAATRGRSRGTCTSFSTMDAMMRTSYGVSFFERAYFMSTWCQARSKAASWSSTSCTDVVSSLNS
jgi:hypothetical protein